MICFDCKHYDVIGGCSAFKGGVIPKIIIDLNAHDERLVGQLNNFVFDPINDHTDDEFDHLDDFDDIYY